MSYNLLEEKWIPVLWKDGKFNRIGIIEAFTEAGRIRQIAASNPMDRVAILRFLLALLYWRRGNPPDKIPDDSFPSAWFRKLDDHRDCFNLLGEGNRFYQIKPKSGKVDQLSANYLMQEAPTGTNFWHFRHSTDKANGLCRACCAMGLLRLPSFATSGGRGKPPGVNAKPPVYVIPSGSSLADTLLLSWRVVSESDFGVPAWEKSDLRLPEKGKVPLLTGLTWLPRRVWLDNPDKYASNCISCGRKEYLIRQCVYDGIGSVQPITKTELDGFPVQAEIPKNLERRLNYDRAAKNLTLKGNMSVKERDKLLKLSKETPYQDAVNRLFSTQPYREWSDPHTIRDGEGVIHSGNSLRGADAAAGHWVAMMAGILRGQKSISKGSLWIAGFATVQNDKYLEATEYSVSFRSALNEAEVLETINKCTRWEKQYDELPAKIRQLSEKNIRRKHPEIESALVSIRPHVEGRVSDKADELMAGGDDALEYAAREHGLMMAVIAKSLSPGFTVAAVQLRNRIANLKPDMGLKTKRAEKSGRKKGGNK